MQHFNISGMHKLWIKYICAQRDGEHQYDPLCEEWSFSGDATQMAKQYAPEKEVLRAAVLRVAVPKVVDARPISYSPVSAKARNVKRDKYIRLKMMLSATKIKPTLTYTGIYI